MGAKPLANRKPCAAAKYQAEYESIEYGLTYKEVVEIMGAEGKVNATNTRGPPTITTYDWVNDNGDRANITFSSGRVTVKDWIPGDTDILKEF